MSKTNKTEETKATTETTATTATTSKKGTWLNRLFSAVIGAAVAVGAMFGITNEKIAEEKTKVETIQTQAKEALDAIKNGDIKTATAKLTEATAVVKEVANDVKEVAAGYECGLVFEKFNDVAELDTVELYVMEEKPR